MRMDCNYETLCTMFNKKTWNENKENGEEHEGVETFYDEVWRAYERGRINVPSEVGGLET